MRRRVGMFFVFVWGLSLAEHIDFSRKDMCNTLTQCTGKAWLDRAGQGRAANRGQVAKRCWHRRVAKRARQLQVEPRFNRLFKWMTLKNL